VIGSSSDKDAKDVQKQAVFELTKVGVRPTEFGFPEMFPTERVIADATALAKRSGSRSLVCVGSGSVADAGKAVRERLGSHVELIVIPTVLSPVSLFPSFAVLHREEDLLVRSVGREPSLVALDANQLSSRENFNLMLSRAGILVYLYDVLFDIAFNNRGNSLDTWHAITQNTDEITSSFALGPDTDASTMIYSADELIEQCIAVASLRDRSNNSMAGPVVTSVMAASTRIGGAIPFSTLLAQSLGALVDSVEALDDLSDTNIDLAAREAFERLLELTNHDSASLRKLAKDAQVSSGIKGASVISGGDGDKDLPSQDSINSSIEGILEEQQEGASQADQANYDTALEMVRSEFFEDVLSKVLGE
jgi:hypothetical protein